MKVLGYEVPEKVLHACLDRMASREHFTARGIVDVARSAGYYLRSDIAERLVDRLIQAHRKSGDLTRVGSPLGWRWRE